MDWLEQYKIVCRQLEVVKERECKLLSVAEKARLVTHVPAGHMLDQVRHDDLLTAIRALDEFDATIPQRMARKD